MGRWYLNLAPRNIEKYLVLLGCTLLLMPSSMQLYYGNILPYIVSYYKAKSQSYHVWLDPVWVVSLCRVGQPLGMVLVGYLVRSITVYSGLVAGVILVCGSIISSYFAIEEPVAFALIFGLIHGIGAGFLIGLSYKVGGECIPQKKGLVFGILALGPSVYPMINNTLAYYFINPDNSEADLVEDKIHYFTDPQLIDRVPAFFYKIGLCTTAISITGLILAKIDYNNAGTSSKGDNSAYLDTAMDTGKRYEHDEDLPTQSNSTDDSLLCSSNLSLRSEHLSGKTKILDICPLQDRNDHNKSKEAVAPIIMLMCCTDSDYHAHTAKIHSIFDRRSSSFGKLTTDENTTSTLNSPAECTIVTEQDDDAEGMSPPQVLQTFIFWRVWFLTFLIGYGVFFHSTMYKLFGQTTIKDDNLLVMTGTVSAIVATLLSPFSGFLVDRLGVKMATVILLAVSQIAFTATPISLHEYAPLYIILVVVQFYALTTLTFLYKLIPLALFGTTYFPSNMGLVISSHPVIFCLAPLFMEPIIKNLGWDYFYLTVTGTIALGLFVCLSLPEMILPC